MQDANFYLLTLFEKVPDLAQVLTADPDLQKISDGRNTVALSAAAVCGGDPDCLGAALIWDEAAILAVSSALATLFGKPSLGVDLAGQYLRPSGIFQLHASQDDVALVVSAWKEAAEALNRIWFDYVRTVPPEVLADLVDTALGSNAAPFYSPLLAIDLAGMAFLGMDEAGRYEPLEEGENSAAVVRIPSINWEAWPYSLILVLGYGPLNDVDRISGPGLEHTAVAVDRYNKGLAPLLLFSGGHVHPDGTPYCEAIEMKRVAMMEYGVPEDAILVDPYARHTTTNMRNGARVVLRYGLPPDRPVLVVTDIFQTGVINYSLADRCIEELGYVPWRSVAQLGDTDTCLLVDPLSLYRDARDPLDP